MGEQSSVNFVSLCPFVGTVPVKNYPSHSERQTNGAQGIRSIHLRFYPSLVPNDMYLEKLLFCFNILMLYLSNFYPSFPRKRPAQSGKKLLKKLTDLYLKISQSVPIQISFHQMSKNRLGRPSWGLYSTNGVSPQRRP